MKKIMSHITKCVIAGIVAILPIGGLILTVGYFENMVSSSGLDKLPFYFPGLGLIAVILFIYLLGLTTTNFIGKWVWNKIDAIIHKLPALGKLYSTLKQILGYGEGDDAIFQESVLVPGKNRNSEEFGLVTNKIKLPDGEEKLLVFIPGAPNPSSGQLIVISADKVKKINFSTNDTFKTLVAVGKTEIEFK